MKRVLSFIFALLFIFSTAVIVSAEDEDDKVFEGGSDGVKWKYENSVLTVSGKGTFSGIAPSSDWSDDVWYVRMNTKKIVVKNGITSLGEFAFLNFHATEISLPNTLVTINREAFTGSDLVEIVIPESVKVIGDCIFDYCKSLKKVRMPKTVDSFGNGVFYGCHSLTDVNLPENVTDLSSTFEECRSLKTVDIPDGVTILSSTFRNCPSLVSVEIPEGVTYISMAFEGCSSLKKVTLPKGIKNIYRTFKGCSSLTEITIPEGVTEISWHAFTGTAIKKLVIPASVKVIGQSEKYPEGITGMPKLEELIFEGHMPVIYSEKAISDLPKLEVVNYYEGALGWGDEICGFKTEAIPAPAGHEFPKTEEDTDPEDDPTDQPTEEPEEEKLPFTDVSADAEEYEAIRYVYENNLFRGTSETTFSPEVMMNRAMFVTVLGRLAGVADTVDHSVSKFPDVPVNSWYTGFVTWANAEGVVKGYGDGRFGPDDIVTVEQAVTFIYRFVKASSNGESAPENVSGWAKESVSWAIESGVLNLDEIKDPEAGSTRALVAEMLYRLGYSEE